MTPTPSLAPVVCSYRFRTTTPWVPDSPLLIVLNTVTIRVHPGGEVQISDLIYRQERAWTSEYGDTLRPLNVNQEENRKTSSSTVSSCLPYITYLRTVPPKKYDINSYSSTESSTNLRERSEVLLTTMAHWFKLPTS